MVYKRLLGALGVGGPKVDTVLDGGPVVPGGALTGQVHLEGGSADAEIEHISVEFVARVEAESDDGEHEGAVVFHRAVVGHGLRLAEGEYAAFPFSLPVPWETPITELYGQELGVVLGVRTELAVAGARDAGDLDPLTVRPLPAQEAVLEALGQLGFAFKSADLEFGHIPGTGQTLPFYQEIELYAAPQYSHALAELEVTFLADPARMEVVLEADKRGGLFAAGHDALARHAVPHEGAGDRDWSTEVDDWIRQLVDHRSALAQPGGGLPGGALSGAGHGGHSSPYGQGKHPHEGGHGPGAGAVVAAGAAGLAVGAVGGWAAAEVIDEVGDFFEGEEDEEG